jgi:hypothetical protein
MSASIIHKFIWKYKVKPAENLQRQVQSMECIGVHDWCSTFSEGHEEVTNSPNAYIQPTTVTHVNNHCVKGLILENR